MGSRREEERNEKIIRGLMKLPPNRRCINCNSLVPQYICTNFWTFVCTTCSGIHREFTHRVKSVSMAKFTTQELEALQNGGNQRAREIYLKDWDAQGLRLPDNSKPDKIREFIKNVYVDKKYAGGKSSEKPSGDVQLSSHEDEIRRASSYHSYSQSPPYDFQYEERRYGKRAPTLSRKPGSDRGLYDKKFSSFLSPSRISERSPDRVSDHVYEDRFPIERSNSRASDCSVFSGSDPFKSDVQSPNFQKDSESLSSETSRDFSSEDLNYLRNSNVDLFSLADGGSMSHPQRTASAQVNYGVLDKQMVSTKPNDSVVLVDLAPESVQNFKPHLTNHSALPSLTHMNSDGLDLFNAPFAPQNATPTAPSIGMATSSEFPYKAPLDLFQSSTATLHQQPQTGPPSPALFSNIPQQSPAASFAEKSPDLLVPPNEGWATFDIPQHSMGTENSTMMKFSSDKSSVGNFGQLTPNQSSSFPGVSSHGPSSSVLSVSHDAPRNIEAVSSIGNTKLWNAFEDSNGQLQLETIHGSCKEAPESRKYGSQSVLGASISPMPSVPSHSSMPLHNLSVLPVGGHSYALNHVSTNPFDLPGDPSMDYSHVSNLWDMSSLQATLPNSQMPTSFTAGANQPWFSDDAIGPFYPTGSEGGLEFIAGQGSSTPILNGPTHGHVASVGGNPFA